MAEIQKTVSLQFEFFRGIPVDLESDDFFDPKKRNMIILDDLMSTSAKDSRINELFTEGSHPRNLSVVVLNQNLYFEMDPTQRRNCHYLVLFNNPIDRLPVMTIGRQMYPSKSDFYLQKFEESTSRPYGFLLVDLKPGKTESSRLRTDVLQTGNGVDTSEEMEGHDSSDTESTASDIMDDREDLLACRDCGLVFAHYRDLEDHNCRTKSIRLPISGEALEGILRETSATVCRADDLPAYVSDRPKTFVVNTDNCNQEGTHWVVFHFPISGPPDFLYSLGGPETYQHHFRKVLIVNGPQYRFSRCPIQPDFSETYGLYCAYYMKMRCQSIKIGYVLNDFSSVDLDANDIKLIALFSF
ncbi:unnamed protein product [Mytilus coruscus]|uniref:Uncharacterized protein n=1 Tax=Mytilus coruscus TaxID=42192 RepID=A0A6J8BLT0_MYTCO|nr:unnamed protein product [Mytilus coruscus]